MANKGWNGDCSSGCPSSGWPTWAPLSGSEISLFTLTATNHFIGLFNPRSETVQPAKTAEAFTDSIRDYQSWVERGIPPKGDAVEEEEKPRHKQEGSQTKNGQTGQSQRWTQLWRGGPTEKRGTRFCSHALLRCLTRQVNQSTHTHAPGSSNLENKRSTTINAHVIFFHLQKKRQNGTYAKVHCSSVQKWTLLSPPYQPPLSTHSLHLRGSIRSTCVSGKHLYYLPDADNNKNLRFSYRDKKKKPPNF